MGRRSSENAQVLHPMQQNIEWKVYSSSTKIYIGRTHSVVIRARLSKQGDVRHCLRVDLDQSRQSRISILVLTVSIRESSLL